MTTDVVLLTGNGGLDGAYYSYLTRPDLVLPWVRDGGPLEGELLDHLGAASVFEDWDLTESRHFLLDQLGAGRPDARTRTSFISNYSVNLSSLKAVVALASDPDVNVVDVLHWSLF